MENTVPASQAPDALPLPAIVTLQPIQPREEERCPSWQGFAAGTLVRRPGCAPVPAGTAVLTLDGQVIVAHLPYMDVVARAQAEAQRRRVSVRVVGGPETYRGFTTMTPEGVFERANHDTCCQD
jgi:hypothetical protein